MYLYQNTLDRIKAEADAKYLICVNNKEIIESHDVFATKHGFEVCVCPHHHTGALSIWCVGDLTLIDEGCFYTNEKIGERVVYLFEGFKVVEAAK